jgi:Holliday junction resolvase RusA-like endonuclease
MQALSLSHPDQGGSDGKSDSERGAGAVAATSSPVLFCAHRASARGNARRQSQEKSGVTELRFIVPGPPVPAARPRVVRRGLGRAHAFTPARTEAYEQRVGVAALQAMAAIRWRVGDAGPFGLRLDFYREANRGDLDNYTKAAADGITRARVWDDDRHVHELAARMFVDRARPRTEVLIWRLG